MNTLNREELVEKKAKKQIVIDVVKKILLILGIILAISLTLVVVYQVLEVLFILAVLIVGTVRPGRWRW